MRGYFSKKDIKGNAIFVAVKEMLKKNSEF